MLHFHERSAKWRFAFFVPFFWSSFLNHPRGYPRGIPTFAAQGTLTLHSKTDGNAPKVFAR